MAIPNSPHWPRWQRHLFRGAFLWIGLLLATFPFPRPYLPDLGKWLSPLTTAVAAAIARMVGLHGPYLHEIASDTLLMYVHMATLLVLALLGAAVWGWRDRQALAYPKLQYVLLVAARYFLAAAMLSYGFAKVFKIQFYIPEPNTLYTPLGEVPRDLLFWSTMGASHSYSVVTGLIEVLVGILLLFRGTRLAGGCLGIAVMANVVLLNFSYDISVKLYASLLLLLCFVVISPDFTRLLAFLRGGAVPATQLWTPTFVKPGSRLAWATLKTVVVCALLLDAVGLQFETSNFNDDLAPRPPYHGAYAVKQFIQDGDTLAAALGQPLRWQRVFVHRQGFVIVQDMAGQMQDYPLRMSPDRQSLLLLGASGQLAGYFEVQSCDPTQGCLVGMQQGHALQIKLQPLDWRTLPLLQGEFHWTSDAM